MESFLRNEGFSVSGFSDTGRLFTALANMRPELILFKLAACKPDDLHIVLSGLSGTRIPIIALQDQEDPSERVTALTLGADLCLSGTLPPFELSAVIKAFLRRIGLERQHNPAAVPVPECLCYGDITLDLTNHSSRIGDTDFYLTPHEFSFLSLLFRKKTAIRKEAFSAVIWGEKASQLSSRAIDDLVKRLRKKLRSLESQVHILSVWAYGYRLDDSARHIEKPQGPAQL